MCARSHTSGDISGECWRDQVVVVDRVGQHGAALRARASTSADVARSCSGSGRLGQQVRSVRHAEHLAGRVEPVVGRHAATRGVTVSRKLGDPVAGSATAAQPSVDGRRLPGAAQHAGPRSPVAARPAAPRGPSSCPGHGSASRAASTARGSTKQRADDTNGCTPQPSPGWASM